MAKLIVPKTCPECKRIKLISFSGVCNECELDIWREKNEKEALEQARITSLIKQIPRLIELLEKVDAREQRLNR